MPSRGLTLRKQFTAEDAEDAEFAEEHQGLGGT